MTKVALILILLSLPVLSRAECEKIITGKENPQQAQRKLDCFIEENAKLKQELQKIRESYTLLRGEDLRFRIVPLWSETLHKRESFSRNRSWESSCVGNAAGSLSSMGFRIVRTISNATRGQKNNSHLGVECLSVHGYAIIYGFSQAAEFEQFNGLITDLRNRMQERMPEFK